MKLYNYFRSSASFRVRIALNIKGLPYEYLPVHLLRGEHRDPAYANLVGDALVPALVTDEGAVLPQSMAIMEYLEELQPTPALLPTTPLARARVQNAMAQGEVDVRCFAAQAWLPNLSGDYLWSVPLFVQRNLLVSNRYHHEPINPQQLPTQHIGTVLSYTYTSLQPLFESAQLIRDDARNEEQVLQKLQVGRYQYAIASQWTLDWFNKTQSSGKPLHRVALLQEQAVGCYVRNDPAVPAQRILRTLLKMKMSGEIDAIVQRYVDPQTGAQASDTVSP